MGRSNYNSAHWRHRYVGSIPAPSTAAEVSKPGRLSGRSGRRPALPSDLAGMARRFSLKEKIRKVKMRGGMPVGKKTTCQHSRPYSSEMVVASAWANVIVMPPMIKVASADLEGSIIDRILGR